MIKVLNLDVLENILVKFLNFWQRIMSVYTFNFHVILWETIFDQIACIILLLTAENWRLLENRLCYLRRLFIVDKLALLAILALSRCCFMPFLAHFSLIILVYMRLAVQLRITMSVSAIFIEFTHVVLHPVLAKFSLVVQSEVFNIFNHLFSAFEVHLFLGSTISVWRKLVILILLALNFLNLLH